MPGNDPIQSVQRAIRILFLLAGVEDGLTPKQIAKALQVKPSAIYKFLRTLEMEHMLSRRNNPFRYVIGRALTELKLLNDQRHLLTVSAKILLRTYSKMPEANFSLVQHDPPYTYTRFCVEETRPGVLIRRREYLMEPYARASSLIFLAYSSPEQMAHYYKTFPFETEGKPIWKNQERLDAYLEKIRRTGISIPDVPGVPSNVWGGNFYRLSVPVFSPGHEVIAAVGGYVDENQSLRVRKALTRLTREAAQEIMEHL